MGNAWGSRSARDGKNQAQQKEKKENKAPIQDLDADVPPNRPITPEEQGRIFQIVKEGGEGAIKVLSELYNELGSFSGVINKHDLSLLMVAALHKDGAVLNWLLTGGEDGKHLKGIDFSYLIPEAPKGGQELSNEFDKTKADIMKESPIAGFMMGDFGDGMGGLMDATDFQKNSNVLHVVAPSRGTDVIMPLLKAINKAHLVGRCLFQKDGRGNTPLNLAIQRGKGLAIYALHWAMASHLKQSDYQNLFESLKEREALIQLGGNRNSIAVIKNFLETHKRGAELTEEQLKHLAQVKELGEPMLNLLEGLVHGLGSAVDNMCNNTIAEPKHPFYTQSIEAAPEIQALQDSYPEEGYLFLQYGEQYFMYRNRDQQSTLGPVDRSKVRRFNESVAQLTFSSERIRVESMDTAFLLDLMKAEGVVLAMPEDVKENEPNANADVQPDAYAFHFPPVVQFSEKPDSSMAAMLSENKPASTQGFDTTIIENVSRTSALP